MSVDELLQRANRAPFSVVGALVSLLGLACVFHSITDKDAFRYGFGPLSSGAIPVGVGTILQHNKNLQKK